MDRVDFIESVSGIAYPEMVVHFFDHFVALKQLVEDTGSVKVLKSRDEVILFAIDFDNKKNRDIALNTIQSVGNNIVIYGRTIAIKPSTLGGQSIIVELS